MEILGGSSNLNKKKTKNLKSHEPVFYLQYNINNVTCLNWEMLQFYPQNELISNLKPATGLKIVGTGHVYNGLASPLLFKTVWRHLCIKVMSFWGFGVEFGPPPFLPDIDFQLLKSSWSYLTYFLFNGAPNVLYRWKIWTAGRPIQHPDSSTTKPCCCNCCSVWFCIVLLNTQGLPWNRNVIWRGAYVALKPLYTFQHS